MQTFRRTPSSSSTSSTSSLTAASGTKPIPRKRVSPAQLKALNAMYHAKSHPSREERLALSAEIGMELKAVTIWLQNKRQTTKKNARVSNENTPPPESPSRPMPPRRTHISLDHIARLSERASGGARTTGLSPRRTHVRDSARTHIDKTDLWQHMPSSPIAAPPSPGADTARLAALPPRARAMRSLEWACAKARVADIRDDEAASDALPAFCARPPCGRGADDPYDTETEVEEPVTPDASADISPVLQSVDCNGGTSKRQGQKGSDPYTSGDVEAAMVLLGFMGRA